MRHSFIYSAEAEQAGTATVTNVIKPEPTSEKLTELRAEYKVKWAAMIALDPDSKEAVDANLEVYKQRKLIEGEIAAIKNRENELLAIERRNAKVAIYDFAIASYDNLLAVNADKKATIEAKNDANAKYKDASDAVKNALAGSATVAKVKTENDGEKKEHGERGATGQRIKELLEEHINSGKTPTEAVKLVIEAGYSRGTTGSVRTKYWPAVEG